MRNTIVESEKPISTRNRVVSFADQTSDGKVLKSTKVTLRQSESHYRAEIKRINLTIETLKRFKLATETNELLGPDHQVVFFNYLENRLERLELQYECYKCNVKAAKLERVLKDINTRLKLHKHSLKHRPGKWEYRTLRKWVSVPTQAGAWILPIEPDNLEILQTDKAELTVKSDILDQRFATLCSLLEQNGKSEQSQGLEIASSWNRFDVKLGVNGCTRLSV
jgi:hypothetical protein